MQHTATTPSSEYVELRTSAGAFRFPHTLPLLPSPHPSLSLSADDARRRERPGGGEAVIAEVHRATRSRRSRCATRCCPSHAWLCGRTTEAVGCVRASVGRAELAAVTAGLAQLLLSLEGGCTPSNAQLRAPNPCLGQRAAHSDGRKRCSCSSGGRACHLVSARAPSEHPSGRAALRRAGEPCAFECVLLHAYLVCNSCNSRCYYSYYTGPCICNSCNSSTWYYKSYYAD